MFPNRKRRLLIEWIEGLAKRRRCSLTELDQGQNDNIVRLQPFDEVSQTGTDRTLVNEFSALIRRQAPSHLKEDVTISTQSKPSGVSPDYAESEPDFHTAKDIYFIELRFS